MSHSENLKSVKGVDKNIPFDKLFKKKKSGQALKELTKAQFLIKKKQFYIIQLLFLHSTKKPEGQRMRRNLLSTFSYSICVGTQ